MPAAIKLRCEGGPPANTGGTGCWTEWGKDELLSTQSMVIRVTSMADTCIILL